MSQVDLLVQALKKELKLQNKTYHDVAKHLKMSEASIKRLFANQDMSLSRIETICQMLNIQISDLLQHMLQATKQISTLTREQEEEIIRDRKLCLVAVCVVNHWTYDDILRFFTIDKFECIQYLAKLDKLKIIELLPNNRIKLLISPHFKWLLNGPIQSFFQKNLLQEYINSNFHTDEQETIFQFGMLTKESNILLKKKIRNIADDFVAMSQHDANEPIHKRFGSVCFLMTKPWATTVFNELIRPEIRDKLGKI